MKTFFEFFFIGLAIAFAGPGLIAGIISFQQWRQTEKQKILFKKAIFCILSATVFLLFTIAIHLLSK